MQFGDKGWIWSPYSRMTLITGKLDAFTETTSLPANALSYGQEAYRSTEIDLGLRRSFTQKTSFGAMSPSFLLKYQRLNQMDDAANLFYADLTNGLEYLLNLPQTGNHQLRVGLGLGLNLKNGMTADLRADTTFGSGGQSGTLRGNISWRF